MKRTVTITTVLLLAACSMQPANHAVDPKDFELLLSGWWDEGSIDDLGLFCGADRNLHRHEFSGDGQHVTWAFEEPLEASGSSEYSYRIVAADTVSLTLELDGEDRTDASGKPYVWQLVIVDNGTFRWRATSFPPGKYNQVIGKRCR